jgi:CBS domain-containing protein
VPVLDEEGNIFGVITMTDLLKILKDIHFWDNIEKSEPEIRIKEFFLHDKDSATVAMKMTKQVAVVSEEDPIEHVVDLMCRRDIHTIPVVKEDKLIGIIGAADIARATFVLGKNEI